ncbi:family 27 glycoside hydrolase [Melampsora americana]|nr:family 27 glycoside hydrolase [Melampsora americana]
MFHKLFYFIGFSSFYLYHPSHAIDQFVLSSDSISPPSNPTTSHSGYRGWSSWSLQAFKGDGYGFYWLDEAHVKSQAAILADEFAPLGYDRINLDSGWQDPELDEYGRRQMDRIRFPSGVAGLSSHLARKGLKLGLYYLPGIESAAVENQVKILGSDYTADEVIHCPKSRTSGSPTPHCRRPMANAFGVGYALNHSHPGSQLYVNSIVEELYRWNVSFVKMDGNVPGSSFRPTSKVACDTRPDLLAWRRAIDRGYEEWRHAGRERIWLAASWELPPQETGPVLDVAADSWRVAIDVEAYGHKMTTFDRIVRNARKAAGWTCVDAHRRWEGLIDMDAVLISDMTLAECRSVVTIWALMGTPFYLGDDLRYLSNERKELLLNPEVLDIQRQTGDQPARLHHFNSTRYFEDQTFGTLATDCAVWSQKQKLVRLSMGETEDVGLGPICSGDVLATSQDVSKRKHVRKFEHDDEQVEWQQQIWVSELDDGRIFLGIVNAGDQAWWDGPIEIEVSLGMIRDAMNPKRRTARGNESIYRVRDAWRQISIGFITFDSRFNLRLDTHDSLLYVLTPV